MNSLSLEVNSAYSSGKKVIFDTSVFENYLKSIFLFSLVGVLFFSLIASPLAFGAMIDSPRKQMAMGTLAEDVVCKDGMALMKRSSGTSACVKPSTAMKLEKVGWGMMLKDVAMMDLHREKMMKDKDMMDNKGMMEKESMKKMTVGGIDVSMAAFEGSVDAPITIVEFGDFQCPKCQQWVLNEKPTIEGNFVDTGMVNLYFLDLTWLGDDSISASKASYCAEEQDMYWEYHKHLYNNQGGIQEGWASVENLKAYAVEVGLDTAMFNECLDSGKYNDRVTYNNDVGASNGVDRTPVFFIVGSDGTTERIDGPQPSSIFESIINDLS